MPPLLCYGPKVQELLTSILTKDLIYICASVKGVGFIPDGLTYNGAYCKSELMPMGHTNGSFHLGVPPLTLSAAYWPLSIKSHC